jgi:hypothetical protein
VVADAPGSLHGFPASLTSFVGRAQATAEIAAQLAEYRARDADRARRRPARWPGE